MGFLLDAEVSPGSNLDYFILVHSVRSLTLSGIGGGKPIGFTSVIQPSLFLRKCAIC